jgi:hypothetical protein
LKEELIQGSTPEARRTPFLHTGVVARTGRIGTGKTSMNIEPVLDGIALQHLYLHPIWPDLSPEWKTTGNKPSLGFPPPCASTNLALRRTSPDGIGVSSAPFGFRCSVHWHLAVWI